VMVFREGFPGTALVRTLTMAAEILFAGSAPGLVGILQINARTPGSFVGAGPVSVQLVVGNRGFA
jgi:uncharacterized protein (TIGR03437 family)